MSGQLGPVADRVVEDGLLDEQGEAVVALVDDPGAGQARPDGFGTSSGVPWKSVMDLRSPVAYPAVWTMPGRTVEAYTLKWAVRSYNGTVLSWTRRIPSW